MKSEGSSPSRSQRDSCSLVLYSCEFWHIWGHWDPWGWRIILQPPGQQQKGLCQQAQGQEELPTGARCSLCTHEGISSACPQGAEHWRKGTWGHLLCPFCRFQLCGWETVSMSSRSCSPHHVSETQQPPQPTPQLGD